MNARYEDHRARFAPSLIALYAVSGFCALALETVWMREVSLRAGGTVAAATLVIAVFFGAAALGNLWGARLARRAVRPLRLYARFEIAAGAAAAATFAANQWLWRHGAVWPAGWAGHAAASLLLVGPPSWLSGVSFPLLAEAFVAGPERRTATGGVFYGANLLGAAAGVVAGSVLLPWWIGVKGAFAVAAGAQVVGGAIAWRIASGFPSSVPEKVGSSVSADDDNIPGWLGVCLLAASGALSLAAQSLLILWAKQAWQGSVYAIAAVLAAFIGGLGLGALAASALRRRGIAPAALLAAFGSASALLLFAVPSAGEWLAGLRVEFACDAPPGMLAEALGWSALWLLPLTTCLGGVFPVAWELARAKTAHQGSVLGAAMALNKSGSAIGIVAGLFVLVPSLGLAGGTCALAWGYLALVGAVAACAPRRRGPWLAASALAAFGLWQTARPHPPPGLLPSEDLVAACVGPFGSVAVVDNRETGSRQLLLNSRQRLSGTGRALASQRHQSWVPLLFCRRPNRVMTIGMASGISAAAALDFPVKELLAVELVPEVARAARGHFSEWNARLFSDPRAKVLVGDGRVVLDRQRGGFDAVICDLFFPAEDGTANLYSMEFFRMARRRLNPSGLVCLWLPCFQHDARSAGVVIRTFLDEFPNAVAVRANLDPLQPVIGLIGSNEPLPLSRAFLERQMASPAVKHLADQSPFLRSPASAWLLLAGDLRAARPGFEGFPPTTDDRPLFAFIGPRKPAPGARLVGMPFLNWLGTRFVDPAYPSCDLGETTGQEMLGSVRAGNFYFAAAIAQSVVPGDTRPEAVRLRQVEEYLARARALRPEAQLNRDDLCR